ncbi:MAG TPA: AAA family ATPase [Chitinophagaceae bacterium]|nr:AAA family ATPase [Chitinophagaceae bacterium]
MSSADIKKIVVLGPESTGKSSLCEQLARHYRTEWCPEYAREYLLKHGKDYSYEDLLSIAQGQVRLEDEYIFRVLDRLPTGARLASPVSLLFFDTDMYVMKVWCEHVFGNCHPFILKQAAARQYDLYLLCNTDLPWVQDELREYPDPHMRERLMRMYIDILSNQRTPWKLVTGVEPRERFRSAVEAVEGILS